MPIAPIESAHSTPRLTDHLSGDPCILGASGDLTRRLLIPAIYNMECDGLLPNQLAIVGMAMDDWTSDGFRELLTQAIQTFHTRKEFDGATWTRRTSAGFCVTTSNSLRRSVKWPGNGIRR